MPPDVAELSGPDAPAALARLRAEQPVAWVPAIHGWLVTGHALAPAVMRDPAAFTARRPASRSRAGHRTDLPQAAMLLVEWDTG